MKIEHLFQRTKAQDPNNSQQLEKTRESGAGKVGQDGGAKKVDTVTISDQARTLQRTQTELKTLKEGLENRSRQERIQFLKAQISSGEYRVDDKMVAATAEAIANSGALGDLVNAQHPLARTALVDSGALEADEDKLAQVRSRIESGYYDSPDVIDTIAERMLDDLLG